jgi:hypothetical protein
VKLSVSGVELSVSGVELGDSGVELGDSGVKLGVELIPFISTRALVPATARTADLRNRPQILVIFKRIVGCQFDLTDRVPPQGMKQRPRYRFFLMDTNYVV